MVGGLSKVNIYQSNSNGKKRPTERGGGFYVQRTVFDVLCIRYSKRRTAAMQPQPAAAQVKRTHINQVVLELEQH